MKKIPSLFQRDDAPRGRESLVIPVVNPACEWVLTGEGVATRKRDGTAILVKPGDHVPWKRFDAKHGKTPPEGFEPAQDPDPRTGHWPGWLRCSESNSADAWVLLAYVNGVASGSVIDEYVSPGTYEACGPMINSNNERLESHLVFRHGWEPLYAVEKITFQAIKDFLAAWTMEGIVWHHPDGRMAKIKTKDFGLKWPRSE